MTIKNKPKAFLVGPFIGELTWELYRFAPYIIYLKKSHPDIKIIAFVRPESFDLYGKYVDILVPLRLLEGSKRMGFTVEGFSSIRYYSIVKAFRVEYNKRFKVEEHIYPDISRFFFKVKWQFSRSLMDYDFKPRSKNTYIAKQIVGKKKKIVFASHYRSHKIIDFLKEKNYNVITSKNLISNTNSIDCSYVGCLIELLKYCKFLVGNIKSTEGQLALLLNTPVISENEDISEDSISLLNPKSTKVIVTCNFEEGVYQYENNF